MTLPPLDGRTLPQIHTVLVSRGSIIAGIEHSDGKVMVSFSFPPQPFAELAIIHNRGCKLAENASG